METSNKLYHYHVVYWSKSQYTDPGFNGFHDTEVILHYPIRTKEDVDEVKQIILRVPQHGDRIVIFNWILLSEEEIK